MANGGKWEPAVGNLDLVTCHAPAAFSDTVGV